MCNRGVAVWELFRLGFSRLQWDVTSYATCNCSLTGDLRPTFMQLTPMLASCYWKLVSLWIVCAWVFLSVLPVWQPASPRAGNLSRQGGNCSVTKTQHWKSHAVTPSIFCQNMEIQLQRDYEGLKCTGVDLGWSSWRPATKFFRRNGSIFSLSRTERWWIMCERAQVWSQKTSFIKLWWLSIASWTECKHLIFALNTHQTFVPNLHYSLYFPLLFLTEE